MGVGMWKSVGIVVVLCIVAYGAAVGTYFLLPDHPTDASFAEGAMKITGPIAAFIIVFLVLYGVFNKVAGIADGLPAILDPKANELSGIWAVSSQSYGESKEVRQSLAQIEVSDQKLTMQGGGLKQIIDGAEKDTGQWQCEAVFFGNGRLVYIYEMEDHSFAENPKTRGVVEAQVQPGVVPMELTGTWSTFGGSSHSGVVTLTKRS